jgi:hypothetical protein
MSLKTFEHLVEEGGLGTAFALRRYLAILEFVLGVAHATARLLDVVVDHRHDGVISDTALARTVVIHDVAGPEPALLHALPRNRNSSDHCAGGKTGTAYVVPSAILARNLEFGSNSGREVAIV